MITEKQSDAMHLFVSYGNNLRYEIETHWISEKPFSIPKGAKQRAILLAEKVLKAARDLPGEPSDED